jgi:hypothetical protein
VLGGARRDFDGVEGGFSDARDDLGVGIRDMWTKSRVGPPGATTVTTDLVPFGNHRAPNWTQDWRSTSFRFVLIVHSIICTETTDILLLRVEASFKS